MAAPFFTQREDMFKKGDVLVIGRQTAYFVKSLDGIEDRRRWKVLGIEGNKYKVLSLRKNIEASLNMEVAHMACVLSTDKFIAYEDEVL